MDIHDAPRKQRGKLGREDAHEACKHNQLGAPLRQICSQRGFEGRATAQCLGIDDCGWQAAIGGYKAALIAANTLARGKSRGVA